MATRRMRIKAVINVSRNTKTEPVEQAPATPSPAIESLGDNTGEVVPSSPVQSPRMGCPSSPAPDIVSTNDSHSQIISISRPSTPTTPQPLNNVIDRIHPSSPKSPRGSSNANANANVLQRPSPSKSPACLLPASGTVLRRSPSPALSRLSNSPGPPSQYLSHPSPVKSPVSMSMSMSVSSYTSPSSPTKFMRSPILLPGYGQPSSGRTTPVNSGGFSDFMIKSPPPNYTFRPPQSPSTSHQSQLPAIEYPGSPSSPVVVSRPSPAQSPVFGSRSMTSSFLYQHLNSNSNSADSHEVASLMSRGSPSSPYPEYDNRGLRSSTGTGGAFSSVSNKVNSTAICLSPSPSFSKTMFEDPEALKKRLEESRKKEGPQNNPTKFATVRKEFFEKLHSGHVPERNKMTILHYTFYNPPAPDGSKVKRKSRSRASSICSDISTSSKLSVHDNIDNNENIGKSASAPSSIAGSRRTTASSVGSGASGASVASVAASEVQSEHGSVASNASSNGSNNPGPRVKVGPDGKLIIDEKSLVVETSESQRARQQIEEMEVVSGADYAVGSSGLYRYKRTNRRGSEWTEKETIRFYRALNQCGTDFSMMRSLFPHRSRHELKSKFKREDKKNPDMISKALQSCVFDPSEKFSDDEEDELGPVEEAKLKLKSGNLPLSEKEKLLNEEEEIEQVICSSEGSDPVPSGGKRKLKKEKEIQLTTQQLSEFKDKSMLNRPGMGKGRKWNQPVEGLVGKKLPKEEHVKKVRVKQEKDKDKDPEKKKRKKKNQVEEVEETPAPGTVSIIIAPGVLSAPILPAAKLMEVKEEKVDDKDKLEDKAPPKKEESFVGKKRNRLPKAKPNVKKATVPSPQKVTTSSQKEKEPEVGDLFRFDASDPLGLKVMPAPLPVAQETELQGDEEGTDGLVIVDLDELNSIQAQASVEEEEEAKPVPKTETPPKPPPPPPQVPSTTLTNISITTPTNTRRKRKKPAPVVPVATARIPVDPFGKTSLTSVKLEENCDGGQTKKVKVLPYRVPGPGGMPTPSSTCLADVLEIEIELSSATSSSTTSATVQS